MARLNSACLQLLWIVVIAFHVVQSIDTDTVQPAEGEKNLVICENYHDDIQCPGGKITIKNAYYGRKDGHTCPHKDIHDTNCKAVDSTDYIKKKCDKNSKCHLEATNSIFGDPCVNTYKYISVDYTCSQAPPNIRSEVICEHNSKKISCPEGMAIKIKNASYGRTDKTTCSDENIKTTNCRAESSLPVVNKRCDNMKECTLEASNSEFGDPCVNILKYLTVDYQCVQAHNIHSEIICEHESKKISCPEGMTIKIKNASYGRTDKTTCFDKNIKTTSCGTENSFPIVNQRCENMTECTLEASNSVFGDPCVNTFKYLSVDYQCVQAHTEPKNKLEIITICESNTQKIKCPKGTSISIEDAFYGRLDKSLCPHASIHSTQCKAANSLQIVNNSCKGKTECELQSTNAIFGDPCVNTYKYLQVKYKCV